MNYISGGVQIESLLNSIVHMMTFKEIILQHCKDYPLMEPTDAVKLAYQSEFGPAHLVADVAKAEEWIKREAEAVGKRELPLFTDIGGGYVRYNLGSESDHSLSPALLARIFAESATVKQGTKEGFLQKIEEIRALAAEGRFAFSSEELEDYLTEYEKLGYPPVSHSRRYKEAYTPAYRVISASYARIVPLVAKIERLLEHSGGKNVAIAIDGHAAAGKTTLAGLIASVFDCNVIHMDDFFLPPRLRTEERLSEAGGNVHYERFYDEVVSHLADSNEFFHGVFDCSVMEITYRKTVKPKKLNIVEGSYSQHPYFGDAYELRIFLDIAHDLQMERIVARNGESMAEKFRSVWIPMEQRYFDVCRIKENSDCVLK